MRRVVTYAASLVVLAAARTARDAGAITEFCVSAWSSPL